MEIREIEVYSYDELSESAKQKAYEDWWYTYDPFVWHHEYNQAFTEFGERFGCRVQYEYNTVNSWGRANFDWEDYIEHQLGYVDNENNADGWLDKENLTEYEIGEVEELWADIVADAKKASQEYTVSGAWVDEIYTPLGKAPLDIAFDADAVESIMDDCVANLAKMAQEDAEYQLSRENFEDIHAYDYKYLQDGTVA